VINKNVIFIGSKSYQLKRNFDTIALSYSFLWSTTATYGNLRADAWNYDVFLFRDKCDPAENCS